MFREQLNKKPYQIDNRLTYLLAIIQSYITEYDTKHINIVDFGGAYGTQYFEIRRFISQDINVRWYVIESEEVVKQALKGDTHKELSFHSSLEEVEGDIDIIYSSSTLQYVPKPYFFLNLILQKKAKWLFFTRMEYHDGAGDIVTVQKSLLSYNGPGSTKLPTGYKDRWVYYPHTAMSLSNFEERIQNGGYELAWNFSMPIIAEKYINEYKLVGKDRLYLRKPSKQ